MKTAFISLVIILIISGEISGQNSGNIWTFGHNSGINFNTSTPAPVFSSVISRGSCVSISDAAGQLLFYSAYDTISLVSGTDPVMVYNNTHNIMQGGDSLKGGGWYNELVIVPDPSLNNDYYLFYAGVVLDKGLYYALVDMDLNGGLGSVTMKNVALQSNLPIVDCLTAIKHGNGRDWWLIFRRWDNVNVSPNNEIHTYLVAPAGIGNYAIQNVGSMFTTGLGDFAVNSNGTKLAYVNYRGLAEVYDFDRCSGLFSNPVNIFSENSFGPYDSRFSCEFSPNGDLLYITMPSQDTSSLFQYDITQANISSTETLIWSTIIPSYCTGALKRGPDNKIYLSNAYNNGVSFPYPYPDTVYNQYNMNLSVIHSPDSLGAACDFQPYSFYLGGTRTYWGLPNNPDYDLGPMVGSICDTLTSISSAQINNQLPASLQVTWISGWQKAFVNASHLRGHQWRVEVFDLLGNRVYFDNGTFSPPNFSRGIELPGIAAGMYVVRLETDKEILTGKFMVQH